MDCCSDSDVPDAPTFQATALDSISGPMVALAPTLAQVAPGVLPATSSPAPQSPAAVAELIELGPIGWSLLLTFVLWKWGHK